MPIPTTDDELILDLGYGLKRAGISLPIEGAYATAKIAVQYLQQCRWEFNRKSPGEMHGSAMPKGPPSE